MKYYILYNDENRGPLEIEELEEFGLNPKSRIWAPGWTEWKDADQVEEIQAYFLRQETILRQAEKKSSDSNQSANFNRQTSSFGENNGQSHIQGQAQGQTQNKPPQTPSWATSVSGADTPGASSSDVPAVEWYIAINNEEVGPVTVSSLPALGLSPDSLVWCESLPNWTPAAQVPALRHLLTNTNRQPVQPKQPTLQPQMPAAPSEDCGKPWVMPIISIVSILIEIVIILTKATDVLWLSVPERLGLITTLFGMPVIICICSIVSAILCQSSRRQSNYHMANRRSGQATAYGWAATIIGAATTILTFLGLIAFV